MDFSSSTDDRRRQFWRRFGVDRAVAYAVMLRGWQFAGGAISTFLILMFFSENQQGFYYVFSNVLAMQTFFEMGFNIVVTNISSHEWSKLRLDEMGGVQGDADAQSRLISLGRLIFRWYAVASFAFIFVIGLVGLTFFATRPDASVQWREPWCLLAVSTGLMLWTLPYNAMLEGCDRVASVNRFRLYQAILGNLAVWSVLICGGGLWAVVASSWMRLACELVFLLIGYRRFFSPFWRAPKAATVCWRTELWPMQWRVAIGGIFNYFALNVSGLVMFYYHGSVVAGRMGITWTLMIVAHTAALAWVQTRTPVMGRLVARREFEKLDRLFLRWASLSVAAMALSGAAIWLGVITLPYWWPEVARRMLGPLETAILVIAFVVAQFPHCQTYYVRAHKRDNLLVVSAFNGAGIALAVWWAGAQYGPIGAVCGYAAVNALILLPFQTRKWMQCRNERIDDSANS
jgi:hypothetical protein